MASGTTTTDHDEIRQWAEERGGRPAAVRDTGGDDDPGVLRIDFPDDGPDRDEGGLDQLSWDDFFARFDEAGLALVYQDETADGSTSRFSKFVRR